MISSELEQTWKTKGLLPLEGERVLGIWEKLPELKISQLEWARCYKIKSQREYDSSKYSS